MSNLILRVLSAAVLLPVVIAFFHFGDWWLKGLALATAAVCFFEYGAVVVKNDALARILLFLTGMTVTILGLMVDDPRLAILSVQVAFVILAALFVLRPGPDLNVAFRTLASLVFGIVWIAPGLICICRLRDLGDALPADMLPAAGSCFIMAAMTTTWANDTCAYFVGRFFGKHKMAGLISPKKTWEGFIGGAIGAPLFLLAGRAIAPSVFAPLTTIDIIVLSVPVSLLGPIGDLAESLWKRAYEVKDSGNLIPGHGGMLDRIDAVFFVTPWVLGYFVALKPLLHP
ncbi:MAG: phosphatidate cytidylyltransferase [Deltaproteobacteria bacterium]|nr:phosphatidate cytidylyltransferase [Deltaproteobacteria bacterium]